jgi:hypothetical protein
MTHISSQRACLTTRSTGAAQTNFTLFHQCYVRGPIIPSVRRSEIFAAGLKQATGVSQLEYNA